MKLQVGPTPPEKFDEMNREDSVKNTNKPSKRKIKHGRECRIQTPSSTDVSTNSKIISKNLKRTGRKSDEQHEYPRCVGL